MLTLSHYTGGNNGWGTMVCTCAYCKQEVAEYNTDENGIPTTPIYDNTETHECGADEET